MNLFHNASFLAVTQIVVLLMLINSKTAHSAPKERLRLFHPYANTYQQMARIYPNRRVMSFAGQQNALAEPVAYYDSANEFADSYFPSSSAESQRNGRAEPAAPAPPIASAFWNKRNVLKKLALQGARGFGK